ncbi:MAG: FecR family protein [Sphingobacteriaceae bacterium]|nr:MAG: FecR family protein [Sphingobacteriaceae bacterium]
MQNHKRDIERLIFQRLSNTISKEDDQLLSCVLEQDERMRYFYESLQTDLASENNRDFISDIKQDEAWSTIFSQLKSAQESAFYLRYYPYAAILLLGIFIVFYFLNQNKTPVKEVLLKQPATIQLTLASGKTLDLVLQKKSIKTNIAEFNTTKTGLTYSSKTAQAANELNTLTVPATYIYHITLSDGTLVWLNSGSQLRFPFTFGLKKREVYISGEAYFKVAKNVKKPFVVHTTETDVIVKGTSFNINTYQKDKILTSLIEGNVVTKDQTKNSMQLVPGQQAVYAAGRFTLQPFDRENLTGWIEGRYYFHDCSLQDLAFVVQRWYNVDVVFSSSKISSHRMSGIIEKNQPISQFINNLTATTQLHTTSNYEKIYIY